MGVADRLRHHQMQMRRDHLRVLLHGNPRGRDREQVLVGNPAGLVEHLPPPVLGTGLRGEHAQTPGRISRIQIRLPGREQEVRLLAALGARLGGVTDASRDEDPFDMLFQARARPAHAPVARPRVERGEQPRVDPAISGDERSGLVFVLDDGLLEHREQMVFAFVIGDDHTIRIIDLGIDVGERILRVSGEFPAGREPVAPSGHHVVQKQLIRAARAEPQQFEELRREHVDVPRPVVMDLESRPGAFDAEQPSDFRVDAATGLGDEQHEPSVGHIAAMEGVAGLRGVQGRARLVVEPPFGIAVRVLSARVVPTGPDVRGKRLRPVVHVDGHGVDAMPVRCLAVLGTQDRRDGLAHATELVLVASPGIDVHGAQRLGRDGGDIVTDFPESGHTRFPPDPNQTTLERIYQDDHIGTFPAVVFTVPAIGHALPEDFKGTLPEAMDVPSSSVFSTKEGLD